MIQRFTKSVLVALLIGVVPLDAGALPFNDDMVNSDVMTGKIMRAAPPGSISEGSDSYHLENREQALKLTNPIAGDKISTENGKRLFQVNCAPCHGNIESPTYSPTNIGTMVGAPNIALPAYHDKADGRTDGSIFGTIHFGSLSGLMPRVGYKLSPTEHWDIINYLRQVQASVKQ